MIAKVRRRDASREIPDGRASLVVSIILKSSTGNHSQNGSCRFRQIQISSAKSQAARPVQLKTLDYSITTQVGESHRMAAGVTDRVWEIEDLIALLD
jgi:hypothetical protein